MLAGMTSFYLGQVAAEITYKIGTFEVVRQPLECLRAFALRTAALLSDQCLSKSTQNLS
jgi:hypothetical protein